MKTIVAVIFLVFVMIVGLTYIEKDRAIFYYELTGGQSTSESTVSNDTKETIKVTLSGQISNPGTYVVEKGTFLTEVLDKAGGETLEADDECFDYYLVLEEDISLYIAKETTEEKISLNEGTADEFETISGIGSTIASRIVEYRSEIGEFTYLEQVMNVSGVGSTLFSKIKNKICL